MVTGSSSYFCTRCGKELTDAASREYGVGPVCRGLDNALLARLIPSNLPLARSLIETLDLTDLAPETLPAMVEVVSDIGSEEPREDWRKDVKRVEWALSYPSNQSHRPVLTNVVRALGYVGLAALWDGKAATGKAHVTFMSFNRLVVQGPRNKAANAAFKAIPGKSFHVAGSLTPKAAWSFPATNHEAFFAAIITHYPNHEGLSEAVEAAKKFLAEVPAPALEAPAPVTPKCSLVVEGVLLKIRSPYNPDFIEALKKAIQWSDRRWNAGEKVWEVTVNHQNEVKDLLLKHYGETHGETL